MNIWDLKRIIGSLISNNRSKYSHVWRLWSWLSNRSLCGSHLWSWHLWIHHTSLSSSWSSKVITFKSSLKLDSFNVLLVFNFFFHVLVSLKELVMLSFSQLKSFIKIGFKFLLKSIHFILLLLNKFGFSCNNFLMSFFHVFLSLLGFKLTTSYLDLMCLSIFLLLSKIALDFLKVQKLWAEFES